MGFAKALFNQWLENEFETAKFSDFRLRMRFLEVMGDIVMGEKAQEDCAKAKGRYRFFKNERVDLCDIFEPHVDATVKRLPESGYLLNIQDTSGLNYHSHNSKVDLGHIGSSPNRPDSFGYWLHTGLLCSSDGTPLGISYQETWARQEWDSCSRDERKSIARRRPIDEKESNRWLDGVSNCGPYRSESRTIVQVADRESDIFEFFQKTLECGDQFLVRAKSNRAVLDLEKQTDSHLFEAVNSKKIKAHATIRITGNSERPSQQVKVGIRWCEVELKVPESNRTAKEASKLSPIRVFVVQVTSRAKVDGKPLNWIILTSLPIESPSDAMRVVAWYALRWRIELFFKTIKSGAKIESSRLIDIDRISKYALMLSIKSFRVLVLTFYYREKPQSSITEILTDYEWKVVKKILHKGRGRPSDNCGKNIEMIAQYGGFQKGKNRIPGILTIWAGWTRLSHVISEAQSLGFH